MNMGDSENLKPFRGRTVDTSRPVQVYRNLNGGQERRWSIRQDGLVVAHTDAVGLRAVKFHVGKSGWQRSLREKRRNVHAWVTGRVDSVGTYFMGGPVRYDLTRGAFLDTAEQEVVRSAGVWLERRVYVDGAPW